MRLYMIERYKKRRQKALDFLGGRCAHCGNAQDLQFDHIDPTTKSNTIAKIWSHAESKFWGEIKKCQLLCQSCHERKTLNDLGQFSAKDTHGTLSSYRYCKCVLCKKANSDWNKKWREETDYNRKRREKRKHSLMV